MHIGGPLAREPAGHCQILFPGGCQKSTSYDEASQVSRPVLRIRVRRAFEGVDEYRLQAVRSATDRKNLEGLKTRRLVNRPQRY